MDLGSLTRRLGSLILHVMGEHAILRLSVENLMVFILPVLTAILATDTGSSTTELILADGDEVHVPDTDQEVLELDISLEGVVKHLVVLEELSTGHILVA